MPRRLLSQEKIAKLYHEKTGERITPADVGELLKSAHAKIRKALETI